MTVPPHPPPETDPNAGARSPLEARFAASPLRDRMIFAVGAPRSGTHWLQRILTAHPDVAGVPTETHLFANAIAPFIEHFHHGARTSPDVTAIYVEREVLIDQLRGLCDAVLGAHLTEGATRLSERSPLHVRHLNLIAETYPDARFVHIIRDPRDVARSMVTHSWGPEHHSEAATLWRESVELARSADVPRYLEVHYEQILADVPAAARSLYRWLELEVTDRIIEGAAADARVHVNVDPQRSEVGLRKWTQHLKPNDVEAIEDVAGELMAELGYERATTTPWPKGSEPGTPTRRASVAQLAGRIRRHMKRPGSRSDDRHDAVTAASTFEELLHAIHLGEHERLEEILMPNATVKLVDGSRELLRTGPEGIEELRQALVNDPAFRNRQVSSSVHSAFPTTVAVLGYADPTGGIARRLIVGSARGRRIAHVGLHRI